MLVRCALIGRGVEWVIEDYNCAIAATDLTPTLITDDPGWVVLTNNGVTRVVLFSGVSRNFGYHVKLIRYTKYTQLIMC